jgi:hypothetical protein
MKTLTLKETPQMNGEIGPFELRSLDHILSLRKMELLIILMKKL